jgi:deoxyribonuclease V
MPASACLLADRTGQVAGVPPYRSGQFCLRELPPLHAVLDGLAGVILLIVGGDAGLDPGGRPGLGAQAPRRMPRWGYR